MCKCTSMLQCFSSSLYWHLILDFQRKFNIVLCCFLVMMRPLCCNASLWIFWFTTLCYLVNSSLQVASLYPCVCWWSLRYLSWLCEVPSPSQSLWWCYTSCCNTSLWMFRFTTLCCPHSMPWSYKTNKPWTKTLITLSPFIITPQIFKLIRWSFSAWHR